MYCDFILWYEAFEMSQLQHRGKNLHSKMNPQRGYTVHDTFCFLQSEKGPRVSTDEQLHWLLLQVFVNESSVKITSYFLNPIPFSTEDFVKVAHKQLQNHPGKAVRNADSRSPPKSTKSKLLRVNLRLHFFLVISIPDESQILSPTAQQCISNYTCRWLLKCTYLSSLQNPPHVMFKPVLFGSYQKVLLLLYTLSLLRYYPQTGYKEFQ